MISFFKKFFGNQNFNSIIEEINSFEPELEKLRLEELKGRSLSLKENITGGKNLNEALPEAFALVREISKRTLGQRHYDSQLIGGIVLHQGKIAEMATGEGKTLAATLTAYLNALSSDGVHIITVNDYLAKRDVIWMGQIYHALGLSIGCLTHESAYKYDPDVKVENAEDKERDVIGGFKIMQDFLRPISRKDAYQCDILYGTNHEFGFDYLRDNLAYDSVQQAQRGKFYYAIIDEADSILIDEARTPLIIAAPDSESSEFYKIFARLVKQLNKEEDYLVDEKMKSVSITDSGIDKVEKLLNIKELYGPENIRLVHYLEESLKANALFYKDKQYIIESAPTGGGEIIIIDEFTGRKMYGRRYSGGLHQAVEAKEGVAVKQESRTYASITIQNYFRLYEKIAGMTGTAQTSAEEFHKVYGLDVVSIPTNKPVIRKDLSDLIYKNSEIKYKAVAEEIKKINLIGQPMLIGTANIEHNELLSAYLQKAGVRHEVLNAKNHEREGAIIAQAGKLGAVTVATNMAGRGVDIILGGNPENPEQRRRVLDLGGLHVIGTERHEARRIDNQLRGRAGRQGDAGSSQFILSLEDDLLRVFGGEKIKGLLERFNLPEDSPIESRLISKIVNEAQKKIEGLNFDARKHLLEYDDVINKQRKTFYSQRRDVLFSGDNISEIAKDLIDISDETAGKIKNSNEQFKKGIVSGLLSILDMLWMNHLENMEALRESVRLRAYGQHDPLVEYRKEGHKMFQEVLGNFKVLATEGIEKQVKMLDEGKILTSVAKFGNVNINSADIQNDSISKKIGRNDPCYCGKKNPATNKPFKYKKCCYPKFG